MTSAAIHTIRVPFLHQNHRCCAANSMQVSIWKLFNIAFLFSSQRHKITTSCFNKTVSKCNMHLNKVYTHRVHSATKFRFEKMGGGAFCLVSTHVNVKLKSISYPAYFFHRRVICKEKNKFIHESQQKLCGSAPTRHEDSGCKHKQKKDSSV